MINDYDFDRLGIPDWIDVPEDWRLAPMRERPRWSYSITHQVYANIPNPDPLTDIGKTGITIAPNNLRQFLRRTRLDRHFEIVRYNVLNDRKLWRTLPRYPDAIFLMFTSEANCYYAPQPPPYNRYKITYGGFWDDRQIGIVYGPGLGDHPTTFRERRYQWAMERSHHFLWE